MRTKRHKPLTGQAQGLIDALLAFANLEIESTEQVQQVFMPAAWSLGAALLVLRQGEHPAYVADQAAVRRWLKRPSAHRAEINAWLAETRSVLRLMLGDAGIEVRIDRHVEGIRFLCALAMATLLDVGPAGVRRIARCGYRNCRHWFLRSEKRRGIVAMFCPGTNHAGIERVYRSRDLQREAREKQA